jgi:hypothetical protein
MLPLWRQKRRRESPWHDRPRETSDRVESAATRSILPRVCSAAIVGGSRFRIHLVKAKLLALPVPWKAGCCRRSPRALATGLRVTQTVDGNKGIHCVLPKAKLPPRR